MIRSFSFAPEQGVPPAVAPFAHATAAGDTLYVTGQMPTGLDGRLIAGGLTPQTHRVMENLQQVLTLCGGSLDDVVSVRAYLLDFERGYIEFNEAYARWFPGRLPSRTCIGTTGLAKGALVEIDLVAWRAGGWSVSP